MILLIAPLVIFVFAIYCFVIIPEMEHAEWMAQNMEFRRMQAIRVIEALPAHQKELEWIGDVAMGVRHD